jgi:hypothetical protein
MKILDSVLLRAAGAMARHATSWAVLSAVLAEE